MSVGMHLAVVNRLRQTGGVEKLNKISVRNLDGQDDERSSRSGRSFYFGVYNPPSCLARKGSFCSLGPVLADLITARQEEK